MGSANSFSILSVIGSLAVIVAVAWALLRYQGRASNRDVIWRPGLISAVALAVCTTAVLGRPDLFPPQVALLTLLGCISASALVVLASERGGPTVGIAALAIVVLIAGLCLAKAWRHERIALHRPLWESLLVASILVGLPGLALYLAISGPHRSGLPRILRIGLGALTAFAAVTPALALAWVAVVIMTGEG